jgi:hypothetical protein
MQTIDIRYEICCRYITPESAAGIRVNVDRAKKLSVCFKKEGTGLSDSA